MPSPAAPLSDELPLCGNGVLDPGELCDDGNRIASDGCNAFCSAFDSMTSACTMAGQSTSCPFGKPQVVAPAQSTFCDLRAIDAGPDGSYVIFSDVGALFRYDLYVDNVATSIKRLSASTTFNIQPICSLAVWDDGGIMIHECEQQRLRLITPNGQTATTVADMHLTLKPAPAFRAYYDRVARTAIFAGESVSTTSCVQVWSTDSLLADIPCIVYNVWSSGVVYPSYSIVGMHPRSIIKEPCPRRMQQTGLSMCYSLLMQRDDMNLFTAYVHTDGGLDIGYQLNTNTLDTALGIPIVRTLGTHQVYTLIGSCFMMESRVSTQRGNTPPIITLGNSCRNVPSLGWPCATPLNNPFITDVLSSPYLLPNGLSATHTHTELSAIFSSTCPTFNTSGPLLYRGILQNTYANTTPVDFTPLPGTQDIVYITSTTIGFISSKRTQLSDRINQGYCRPTNLIYCPHGFFGSVGSTCASCTDTLHPMYGKSVAWQIKCASLGVGQNNRRLLLAQTPPFERMSMIIGGDPQDTTIPTIIQHALSQFTQSKGMPPPVPSETFLTPMQQYNIAADHWTSLSTTQTATKTLVECLIASAENVTRRSLFKNKTTTEGAEFISTLLSYTPGQPILNSIFKPVIYGTNDTSTCTGSSLLKDPVQAWLHCVTYKTSATSPYTRRRRLLQAGASGVLIRENHGTTLGSNTAVSWSAEQRPESAPPSAPSNSSLSSTSSPSASPATFPIWAAATIAGVGLLVLLFLVYLFYRWHKKSHNKKTP